MKITLLAIGKTDVAYLKEGIEEYVKRINRYINFSFEIIPDIKKTGNLPAETQKKLEGELIVSKIGSGSEMLIFDENGKTFTSREFSDFLQRKMASGLKELIFVIGGPYGFSEEVYKKVGTGISLSKFTFSHQMVRLLCVEQLYRAFTIINNEPYHHD